MNPAWLPLALALAAIPARAEDFPAPQRSTAPIRVVYPSEGASLPSVQGQFILGSVSDPKANFSVNGQTVPVHSAGGFLAWLPVEPGTFSFRCLLELPQGTTAYERKVFVTPRPPLLAAKPLALDPDSLWPRTDIELRPGDWLFPRLRASPGRQAQARWGKRSWQPLRESSPGTYEASWLIQAGENHEPAPVEYRLKEGWSNVKGKSLGRLAASSGEPAVAVLRSTATLKTGPGQGYLAFPLPGTKLLSAGRAGGEMKVALSQALEAWVDMKDVDLMPPGTSPPRAVVGTISASASGETSTLRIGLTERVPFLVEESEDLSGLTLRLFYSTAHTNWIVYDSNDPLVSEVRWRQEATGVVAIVVRLRQGARLWGFQPSFEEGAQRLELRRIPALAPPPASPLQGLTIILDPGHMPSAPGAIGPLGTREMDLNFALAKAVETRLAAEGARPVLTREAADQEVSLAERPRLAVEKRGDLFVSLHHNAIPDGENPFARPRGYSVFYYHPHSLALAEALYRSYQKRLPLPGENHRYGNLLVARLSAMPAVLLESAYLIFPEQEQMLLDPQFREELAGAVVEGLRSTLEAERSRQQAAAQPGGEGPRGEPSGKKPGRGGKTGKKRG